MGGWRRAKYLKGGWGYSDMILRWSQDPGHVFAKLDTPEGSRFVCFFERFRD